MLRRPALWTLAAVAATSMGISAFGPSAVAQFGPSAGGLGGGLGGGFAEGP